MDQTAKNDRTGALYIVSGCACFATGAAIIKHLADELSWAQLAILRHIFAAAFFLPMMLRLGPGYFLSARPWAHGLRGALGSYSYALFVLALVNMPMGDASALAYTTPFWSLGVAALAFGERFGWGRVAATALGFAGVALIVRPGSGATDYAPIFAGVALLSAFLTSLAMMMVKRLSSSEPPDRIAFWFLIVGIPCLAPFAAIDWRPIEARHLPWLAVIGGLAFFGQRALSRGYMLGTFSKMAPLVYVQVALAALWGLALFGEIPPWTTLAGMALIAVGTIWIVRARADGVTSKPLP
ncbi:MAG: DMT family transporter [Tagaea sp.]|nr:DMT family transporter [Tagaea sp.]